MRLTVAANEIIILDTNVWVSAVLKGRELRTVIQFIIDNPKFEWVVSIDILAEYKEVLSQKKKPEFDVRKNLKVMHINSMITRVTLREVEAADWRPKQ